MTAILLSTREAGSIDGAISFELTPGVQSQGVYRRGRRLGAVVHEVRRDGKGWRIARRFDLEKGRAAEIRLRLRGDLSLDRLTLEADLTRLGDLVGLSSLLLGDASTEAKQIRLAGDCNLETGVCRLHGRVAGRQVSLPVSAGRGPVIESAIFPLLARGSLGRTLEVMVFDPLSMQQRAVVYRVEKWEPIELRIGRRSALQVSCEVSGLATRVWLDQRGMVLREVLPLGVVLEHESWSER